MGKNICGGCNLIFGSVDAFDRHRVGGYGDPIYKTLNSGKVSREVIGYTEPTIRCLTEVELAAKGWQKNERGWWTTGEFDVAAMARLGKRIAVENEEDTTEEESA